MTKNLYYRSVLRKPNFIREVIFDFFLHSAHATRPLVEVFIRRHFGERYFSFASTIIWVVILLVLPIPFINLLIAYYRFQGEGDHTLGGTFLKHFLTWYAFVAAFLYFAIKRKKEIKRLPSVFDFQRFSLSNGTLTPEFAKLLERFAPKRTIRQQEILLEPLLFFAAGILLLILSQSLGWLLIFSSLVYSLSYVGAYYSGDNFVMDQIDEMILNEEMEASFIDDETPENTRGVRFFMRKPTAENLRRKVSDSFVEDDDEDVSIAR